MNASKFEEGMKCIKQKVEELSQLNRAVYDNSFRPIWDLQESIWDLRRNGSVDVKIAHRATTNLMQLSNAYSAVDLFLRKYEKLGLKSLEHISEIMKKL